MMSTKTAASHFSLVLEIPVAEPDLAHRHFLSRLAFETDPADVMLDLARGQTGFMVLDVRSPEDYAECHVKGALSLPQRRINAETTAGLPADKVLVVYCWGPSCNGSTRAAAKLSALGFKVKEMIGGFEYWRREGGAVEGTQEGRDAPPAG